MGLGPDIEGLMNQSPRRISEKWETKDGQKRSKAVFMVNDAGPSIRFEPIVSDGPAAKRTDKQAVETVQEAFDTEPPEEEPF